MGLVGNNESRDLVAGKANGFARGCHLCSDFLAGRFVHLDAFRVSEFSCFLVLLLTCIDCDAFVRNRVALVPYFTVSCGCNPVL